MITCNSSKNLIHIFSEDLSVLIKVYQEKLPEVVYWGTKLNDQVLMDSQSWDVDSLNPPLPIAVLEEPINYSILPSRTFLYRGHQGLRGSRCGRDFAVRLVLRNFHVDSAQDQLKFEFQDNISKIEVISTFKLVNSRLLSVKYAIKNLSSEIFELDELSTNMPLPERAVEILDFSGSWCKERVPQRHRLVFGKHTRESRRGRTGHDATTLMLVGTSGFRNESGELWGVHLGWSGDQFYFAEKSPSGHQNIGSGELFESGEISLEENVIYETPETFYVYSNSGLNGVSEQFHQYLRSLRKPEPNQKRVIYNSWESVYFDLNEEHLSRLVLAAKEIGAELFVIDDGWFKGRRNANAGLGDWEVDEAVFPSGLNTFIDFVEKHGMDFGIWVEPEMVNIDSDAYRANPEWLLKPNQFRLPPGGRGGQQGLDLSNAEAFQYVFDKINTLLSDYKISYLKWDMNRDLVDAGHDGKPAVHSQTLAVYRLFSNLKRAHPNVEFENCSSGGGRIDLGIAQLTDRTWVSDTNDPLERASIQRWTSMILPLEMMGNDVSTAESHTTARTHAFSFRAAMALFGHLGIQQDLLKISETEKSNLSELVEFYKKHRNFIHSGIYVNADLDLDNEFMHGVISHDSKHAIYVYWKERNTASEISPKVRFPKLSRNLNYSLTVVKGALFPSSSEIQLIGALDYPQWMRNEPISLPGSVLTDIGLHMPILSPEKALILEVKSE